MRYSASEKFEIIELVEQSSLSIPRTLAPIGIPRSTFYDWYSRYQEGGIEALEDGKPRPRRIWNKIPDKIETAIVNLALEEPDLSPRELAVNFTDTKGSFVSEATVYRLLKDHGLITSTAFILMKAADRFANPTTAPNQLWQTDFTYLKVIGWGWFYLSTVLDDFSRYILAWKLCTTMSATDVSDRLLLALRGSGLNQVKVLHRPRLLSDNGPSYVSSELGKWLEDNGIRHIRGRPYHPMTQGKIERYHRSMKNRILLDNYYLPGQLEQSIEEFVRYYNNCRYHESLDNLTPADVYFGRGQAILERREKIKRKTIEQRRCCTGSRLETDKIRDYLERIGVPPEKVTFILGSTDDTLPRLEIGKILDFAYVDGCHGYPFPALDWHYIDKHLKIGGLLGMDNVELRPVREHCEFLEENEIYRLAGFVFDGYFVRFYEKQADQEREWVDQRYSRAKHDPCDWRLSTRIRRKVSKLLKPYLY